jgi:cytoskeletal protein RodZ
MPTLGEELRHRREQRGVTLAEIAEATRIGTRFLKAIETNSFSILPGGIFTRSFIRAYAKHVGMNEDEAIALYQQQIADTSTEQQEAQPVVTAQGAAPAEKPQKQSTPTTIFPKPQTTPQTSRRYEPIAVRKSPARTNWPTIVIGAGIVIFIALIVVALVKQLNQGKGETPSQPSAIAQKNEPSKSATQPTTQPATAPQGASSANPPDQTAGSVPKGQPLVVKLEAATGDSWVKYQIDDLKPTTLIIKQGQTQNLPPAQTQVTVNYGNRTTLKMKINDRDASFPADAPKFKSKVVISRDNLKTFFQ